MMDLLAASLALILGVPPLAGAAGGTPPNVQLPNEHRNVGETFRFRTPSSWTVETVRESPEVLEARGDGMIVRLLHRTGDAGYDSLHADCMLQRLAEAMDMAPQVRYEYDFLSWTSGPHRALDSAFDVTYDDPVLGHRQWRQRNLTVVGPESSLCVITYCPSSRWKKSGETRVLLDGIVRSVELFPWR